MNITTHYKFDNINNKQELFNFASNQYDAKLNSLNGTLPTVGNSGPDNNTYSISFDGNKKQNVTIPSFYTSGNGLSFSFWIKSSSNNATIFDFGNGQDSDNIIAQIINGSFSTSVYIENNIQKPITFIPNINNINNNGFNHITWTLSPSPSIGWTIYLNGNYLKSYNGIYPNSMYRKSNYIGKSNSSNNSFFTGNIADFCVFNNVLTQTDVTTIFTQSKKTPYSPDILNKGFNQLYTPIFCNFMPTNNNFNTCSNCNFGSELNINNHKNNITESECLNKCKTNNKCTSYSFNKTNRTCTEYSDFPTEIYTGVKDVNSGYNLGFTFDYNSLDQDQKTNIQEKCALQFTNNIFTPNNQIDLGSCLKIENTGGPSVNLNYDPKCVYDKYKDNNLIINESYIVNDDLVNSVSDPILDKYKTKYESYITDRVQLSNLNNSMSNNDQTQASIYFNNINENNKMLGNQYLKTINKEMDPLVELSKEITDKINTINTLNNMNEGFDNNNSNIGNNFLKFIIFIIIIVIIFTIIYNICK
jgi:hypothetical protein